MKCLKCGSTNWREKKEAGDTLWECLDCGRTIENGVLVKEGRKTTFKVIVNVNLEYDFEVVSVIEAITEAENVELPKEYVEDSFEIVKIIKEG